MNCEATRTGASGDTTPAPVPTHARVPVPSGAGMTWMPFAGNGTRTFAPAATSSLTANRTETPDVSGAPASRPGVTVFAPARTLRFRCPMLA